MSEKPKAPPLAALSPDEVDDGMRYVTAELARGRAGMYLGKGPGGFALICGHVKVSSAVTGRVEQIPGGGIMGFPLKREQLEAFARRARELLDGKECSLILPVNARGGIGET